MKHRSPRGRGLREHALEHQRVEVHRQIQLLMAGLIARPRRVEWTTTAWVVDEKAYAVGKGKKLIVLKEEGVGSIGGIQGDYEFIDGLTAKIRDGIERLEEFRTALISAAVTGRIDLREA